MTKYTRDKHGVFIPVVIFSARAASVLATLAFTTPTILEKVPAVEIVPVVILVPPPAGVSLPRTDLIIGDFVDLHQ